MPVSVVIPTFNRAALLGRAIDSVLNQTYQDFELLVVDDGSTDGTRDVVAKYGSRLRYLPQQNAGVSAARNAGVRHARFDLIAFLDSDDIWRPQKLELQVPAMADPDVVLCFTNRTWTSRPEQDRFGAIGCQFATNPCVIDDAAAIATWPAGSPIIASASLYRKQSFLTVGGYDERLPVFEDLRLDFRLAMTGKKFVAVSDVLVVLDDSPEFDHLSAVNWNFWRQSTDACVEIYAEALARAVHCSARVEQNLRHGLAYHLGRQAERLALDGDHARARRRAWASLWLLPPWRIAARAVLGVCSPSLLARRSAWRGSRPK